MIGPRSHDPAFRELRRHLLRRRLERFDLRLRGEMALLAVVIGGFLFWQARVPFDGLRRVHGPLAVAGWLGLILLAIAAGSALLVLIRHGRQLRVTLPGPAWLSLPLAPRSIAEHMAWEARLSAGWGAALAPGFLVAAIGLLPAWSLVLLAGAFAIALWALAHVATAIAVRAALGFRRGGALPRDPVLELLLAAKRAVARRRVRATRWRRVPAWLGLWRKDARLALRPTSARARLVAPVVLALASFGVWLLPLEPPLARLLAFAGGLTAAATFAEFLIALAGEDPTAVMKTLPIGAWPVWLSRTAWVLLWALVLAAGSVFLARPLAAHALQVLLVWETCAAIAIGLLCLHDGMTLGHNAAAAQRFLTLTLAISMAASIMIPLLGWIVLLTAVVHSARRVPRWARIES